MITGGIFLCQKTSKPLQVKWIKKKLLDDKVEAARKNNFEDRYV